MKSRHVKGERENARAVLAATNIAIGQDFHTLRSSQVDSLLGEADRVKYRKPKMANGSRGGVMIGGPTDQWLDSVEQHRANAKIRRERGSGTIRILTTAEADKRAQRDAEARTAWENLVHHTKAGWSFAKVEAIEQLGFELHGDEWAEFVP